MSKLTRIAASIAVGSMVTVAGSAHALLIDPFGTAGASTYDVATFGWQNGNSISTPISTVNGTVNNTAVGDTVQAYGHAKLQGFGDANGDTMSISGFNPNSWSYVFGFQETVAVATDVGVESARTFRTIASSTGNFFEIWANGNNAVDLTGKGFNGDGGAVLILSGTVLPWNALTGEGQTDFKSSSAVLVDLDQFGTNQYSGYQTVTGTGGGSISVLVGYRNPNYILTDIVNMDVEILTDTFNNLPYSQVNPSSCFWNGAAYFTGAGNGITDGCGGIGDGGTIGINGVYLAGTAYTNTQFSTRATSVLPIPEPGTLALLGAGLFGMAFRQRRKV